MRERTSGAALATWWRASVAAFVLAASTGAAFRAAIAWGLDTGLTLPNLRHAHSHLMLFGWVTPAIMTLMAASLPRLTRRPLAHGLVRAIGATIGLAFLSHAAFALFGYAPVAIGAARVPPAVIVAGASMIAWYAFAIGYARATWGVRRCGALRAWDLALALLVLSTIAAWALPVLRPLGVDAARWTPVLVHAFLDPFSEGWLVLALLGLLHAARPRPEGAERPLALVAIAIGAPLAFGLAAPAELVPDALRVVSAAGAIVWSLGLAWQLALFASHARDLRVGVALAFGAIVVVARLLSGVTPGIDWTQWGGLRLFYLHALLVGMVSIALFALARETLGAQVVRRPWLVEAALVALVASLVPLTPVWPEAWRGEAVASIAAVAALVASFAAAGTLVLSWRPRSQPSTTPSAPAPA